MMDSRYHLKLAANLSNDWGPPLLRRLLSVAGLSPVFRGACLRGAGPQLAGSVPAGDARIHGLPGLAASDVLGPRVGGIPPLPTEESDDTGRVRKRYRDADVMTPYEKLKSIEDADQCLAPGITFKALDAAAHALSDLQATEALNRARADMFLSIDEEDCAEA